MDERIRNRVWAVLGIVGCAAAFAMPARADDQELERIMIEGGKVRYAQYCTSCHGPAGAPGSKAKSDLRTYVARHGGKFPVSDWIAIVTETRPSSVHAEVWDGIKRDQGTDNADVSARAIVGEIARYVRSIQSK